MTAFTVDTVTDVCTAAAHGLADGGPIVVSASGTPSALPVPLVAGAIYNVRDVTPNTFKIAYYAGGAAIDLTTAGTGVLDVRNARPTSALDYLYESVRAYFGAAGRLEVLDWGRRALTKQINQAPAPARAGRVVFVPGDDTGKAGKLGAPRHPGGYPRAIYSWNELATIHVWGHDPTAPNDERAHYRVGWDLFELTLRALRDAQVGRILMSDPVWTIAPVERVFGCELTFSVTVDGKILDDSVAIVKPTTPDFTAAMAFASGDVPVT